MHNIEVDVIANFHKGKIKPLWLRMETEGSERQTIEIDRILLETKSNFAGFKVTKFRCEISVNDIKKTLELAYYHDDVKWYITD